jgi:hypothetical protein
MSKNKCPVCGIDKNGWWWCECCPQICPHCGWVVRWFGKGGDTKPCMHAIAWGTYGHKFIVWENEKYELKFQKYYSKHSYNKKEDYKERDEDMFYSEEDAIDSFAKGEGLICQWEDLNEFGYWNGSYIVFIGTK